MLWLTVPPHALVMVTLCYGALEIVGLLLLLLWDGSEFQSPTVRTAKEWRNACVEEPTAQNLNRCFALVLSSAATRPTCSGWIPT